MNNKFLKENVAKLSRCLITFTITMGGHKIRLAGVVLLFLSLSSVSQNLRFEKFTTKNGLLSDEVYNVYQDKKGYLWIFTNYGAVKYNSVEFTPVLKNLPFNESFIYSFYENEEGRKWVANSNARIYEIVSDSAVLVKGIDSITNKLRSTVGEIVQLYVDEELKIHAMTKMHSYIFTPQENGIYKASRLNKKVNCDTLICDVKEVGSNQTLLAVFNVTKGIETTDLFRRSGKVYISINTKKDPWLFEIDRESVVSPKCFKKFNDEVYFSYQHRMGKIYKKSLKYIKFPAFVNNFTKDKNGHLWVACYNGGLYELNEQDSIINHYFENITVNCVLADSQNGLWASTDGHGLFHSANINNLSFNEQGALGGPIKFLKKINNELLIADAKGDVYRVLNNQFIHIKESEEVGAPSDIIKTGDNYIFSSTFNIEELVISPTTYTTAAHHHFNFPSAYRLLGAGHDSVIFLYRRGISFLIKGRLTKRIEVNLKTYAFNIRKGAFIIGTEKGVYQYGPALPADPVTKDKDLPIVNDTLYQPAFLKPTYNSIIKEVIKDTLGNYWFCSAGNGLFLLTADNQLSHFTEATGLPSNIINNICMDDTRVLLSTNKGLFYCDSKAVFKKTAQWKCIYTGNVQNAVFFEKKIYISTYNGLAIFNQLNLNQHIQFNLAEVSVNSKQTTPSALKNLAYDKNNIELKFDIIYFTDNTLKIKYDLAGPYHDSRIIDGKTLAFQNLAPGDYTLTAVPYMNNGDALKITIKISIVPAFWQRPVFFILLYIVFCAMIAYVGWLMFKNYKKRQDKKITAEKLILEYKLIAIKAQINPHFVSNCLSAIQNLIVSNKLDAATLYIAKFGLLVRQILNFSSRSLVSLKEELEITRLNIDLEQLRLERNFSYDITVNPDIDQAAIFVPSLILNPIIENAVWHGLIPLKNTRPARLNIRIEKQDKMLLLIIEDNGVGNMSKGKKISNVRDSKGLKLTEQRLENINYLYNSTAKIIYEDLLNQDPTIQGTRVIIYLPVNLTGLKNE